MMAKARRNTSWITAAELRLERKIKNGLIEEGQQYGNYNTLIQHSSLKLPTKVGDSRLKIEKESKPMVFKGMRDEK